MDSTRRLERQFFNRSTLLVARELLGCRLVRILDGKRLSGVIVETEAYRSEADLACHARAGRTARTEVMYGDPGHAYIYFTYGMHWLLNFVTEPADFPAAVLIRALEPVQGIDIIAARRSGQPQKYWTNGPAKLTRALALDGSHNRLDLCGSQEVLFVEAGEAVSAKNVTIGPRVGLYSVPEPWKSLPWRFQLKRKS